LFEHFVVNQILTANAILGEPARLSTYRTEAGSEVDLVVEKGRDVLGLEIKSSSRVSTKDSSGLRRFAALLGSGRLRGSILLYAGTRAYREGAVDVLPWRAGLSEVMNFLR
jgi:predicted AAA+ superfamily ATPase